MKFKHLQIALALFFGVAISAHATMYNYSFSVITYGNFNFETGRPTITSTENVAGSFNGLGSGNLIIGLSNITAFVNGVAVNGSGSLFASGLYNNRYVPDAIVSIDGLRNNFEFSDTNFVAGNYGATTEIASLSDRYLHLIKNQTGVFVSGVVRPMNWSVTSVSAVPEPETCAMLLAGLGLIGASIKRRKVMQA